MKGGTAIKKLFFPEWRYSEDLDFTLRTVWETEAIVAALDEVSETCGRLVGLEVAVASQEPRYQVDRLRSFTVYLAYIRGRYVEHDGGANSRWISRQMR